MTPILPCPRCGQEPTQTMTWTGVTVACRPCDVTCFRFWTSRDRARATLAKVRSEWNSNARRTATTTLPFAILFVGAEGQGKTTLARDTDKDRHVIAQVKDVTEFYRVARELRGLDHRVQIAFKTDPVNGPT